MKQAANYTLFYSPEDGKLRKGLAREEKERLVIDRAPEEVANLPGYRGNGHTLSLTGLQFVTSADIALVVPNGTVIEILEGENTLTVVSDNPEANVAVLYSAGDMTITGSATASLSCVADTKQGLWCRAICARAGNLEISGGQITAFCGQARKSCGVYAGGHLWIETDDKGEINISGGVLSIKSGKNAVRAAEGKLTVAAGARVLNIKEFVGVSEFKGDCLSPIDEEEAVNVSFIHEERRI